MVDFSKMLGKGPLKKETDPLIIFERLDKQSGNEYLRPPQKSVLTDWNTNFRNRRDNIVKLHTGHGKTLTGLLMLQSYMVEGLGPSVYVCPNKYLVSQTVEQADAFGIKTVVAPEQGGLPLEFKNSQAILVVNCNKLFNGFSTFGVAGSGRDILNIGSIAMDDAHRCTDIIRDAFSIKIPKRNKNKELNHAYKQLFAIFYESLKSQGLGTLRDIESGQDSIMAVPFWSWHDKHNEVLTVLLEHKDDEELRYTWNRIKDNLGQSMCIFSGSELQITPSIIPIDLIPSFHKAKRRIFLSATLMDDAFLVRDLGVDPVSVSNPLVWAEAKYSGERMVLIPSMVDTSLEREQIIAWLSGFAAKNGHFGIVALTPSFSKADLWIRNGAIQTKSDNLVTKISELRQMVKQKAAKNIVTLVNQYDGIDLPDATCRILCLDSLPDYSSLIDDYLRDARPESTLMRRRLAQRIEQGIGRAIRGSNDWCIVVVIGSDISNFLRENAKRIFLSKETQMQISIAEDLALQMKKEGGGLKVLEELVNQCLNRDENWKEFYREAMSQIEAELPNKEYLDRAVKEREAETLFQQSQYKKAVDTIQELITTSDPSDKGWYLQLMASYLYPIDITESMDKQLKAFAENSRLFKPLTGVTYSKLYDAGSNRESLILEWISEHQSHSSMIVHLNSILDDISFCTRPELFEEGIKELGRALGFGSQRPEKEIRNGPDNLWNIRGKSYWLISCKNNVNSNRLEISKSEVGQFLAEIAWFKNTYEDADGKPLFIHPASRLASDANTDDAIWVMTEPLLAKLKKNVLSFYNSFHMVPRDRLSIEIVKRKLQEAHLEIDDLKDYLVRVSKA